MRIEIQDPSGYQYSIASRNPETIGRWLIETWAEMATCGWDLDKYRPRVMVWPTWDRATGHPDWIGDTTIIGQGADGSTPEEMLEAMRKQVERYREKTSLTESRKPAE